MNEIKKINKADTTVVKTVVNRKDLKNNTGDNKNNKKVATKSKVGRPAVYSPEVRIKIRREKNRYYQRICRAKKQLKEKSILTLLKPIDFNNYRNDLFNFLSSYTFDYFFTGTTAPTDKEIKKINDLNKMIKELDMEYFVQLAYKKNHSTGIKSLRKATDKYLTYLKSLNVFELCLVFYEQGSGGKYHVHILFKKSSIQRDIKQVLEKSWLSGRSKALPITSKIDSNRILSYCLKEINEGKSNKGRLNKIDNWTIETHAVHDTNPHVVNKEMLSIGNQKVYFN